MKLMKLNRLIMCRKRLMKCVAAAAALQMSIRRNIVNSHPPLSGGSEFFDILETSKAAFKSRSNSPGQVYLQTLGSGAPGASRALYVHTSNKTFLFNCGEGTVRIANENTRPIHKIHNIFFTYISWENIAGLPCLQEHFITSAGVKNIKTCGPLGLESFTEEALKLLESSIAINHRNVTNEKLGVEDSLAIQAVPIWPEGGLVCKDGDLSSMFSNERRRHTYKKTKYAVAYICRAPPKEGSISLEMLAKAQVPPGPLIAQLKNGESVILPNGKCLSPQDVIFGGDCERVFIVLEVPTKLHLNSLLMSEAFNPHKQRTATREEDLPEVIVHFSPPEVMRDPKYLEWVESFPPKVSHIVINQNNNCLGLKTTPTFQMKLNKLLPNVFPLMKDTSIPVYENSVGDPLAEDFHKCVTQEYKFSGQTVQSNSLLTYQLRPPWKFNSLKCPAIYTDSITASFASEEVRRCLQELKRKHQEIRRTLLSSVKKEFPNVVFLGTGSAVPSNFRNVSSILLNIDSESCLLMDCGEGTYGQLVRLFGLSSAEEILRKLKVVYISHHHRDHHGGIITLLSKRREAFLKINKLVPEMYLLANVKVLKFLLSFHCTFEPILKDVLTLNNSVLVKHNRGFSKHHYEDLCSSLNMREVEIIYVPHVRDSFGISLLHEEGWKIVFSGDCMPSTALVDIGQNCDLLIHEATFEDGMEDEAKRKRHSTVPQAIAIGKQMKARYVILTHFSQRYYELPVINDEETADNVGIAFDNMKVGFDDLPLLAHLRPTLKEMFYDSLEELNLRKQNKLCK